MTTARSQGWTSRRILSQVLGRLWAWVGAALLLASSQAAEIRTIIVTNNLTLEANAVLNARLVVRADHIVINGQGASLIGPGIPGDTNSLAAAGTGIFLEGVSSVTVHHLKVSGFATGLRAGDCRGLLVEQCDFSNNYDNPRHGWGELPARGGVLLERVSRSVVRKCRANQVWDGIHLVESDENIIEDNDFSHCSNTCAKLWRASRNRFLHNNLSFGIRIDRAAGEVHARDSTGVLIESGSDDNHWFRNDVTEGGDGIFIRVLNGWVSRGNVFVENDTSRANNNCIESWSPGNTWLRNKANHGSYGFWLGGSDQTVLIGNEAAYNGLPTGNHNAPEGGFGHAGIVFANGPGSHVVVSGNFCHHNNGGGIVFRGDEGSRGEKWRIEHWVLQQNRLEQNKWGIWGRWADNILLAANTFAGNTNANYFENITNFARLLETPMTGRAPKAVLEGPTRAELGKPVVFDASASLDSEGRPLTYRWSVDGVVSSGPRFSPTFDKPGFHRLSLTVENGVLADLDWRDLIVTSAVAHEYGTEGGADWGYELESDDGTGRMQFADDPDAVIGKSSLRFTPNPYPGFYATAIYPRSRDADWDLSGKSKVSFWIRTTNPNLPGFQNAGPVVWLYGAAGRVKIEPAKERNLLVDPSFSEARWTWTRVELPLGNSPSSKKTEDGRPDLKHVHAVGIALDSWGAEPFTAWIDGLSFE